MMASRLLRCLKTRVNSLIRHRNLSQTLALTPTPNPSPFALIRHRNLSQTLTPTPNRSPFALLALRPFSSHPIDTSPLPFHSSTQIGNNGNGFRFQWDLKELDSDDSLWALYERWLAHFDLARAPDEKLERFKIFKESARVVVNHNRRRPDPSYPKIGLTEFVDSDKEKGYPFFRGQVVVEVFYVDMQLEEVEEIRDEKGRKQVARTYTIEDWGDDDCYGCFFE